MLVVLAPITRYKPDLDQERVSGGLSRENIKRVKWNNTEDMEKFVNLEINEEFDVIVRVYGRYGKQYFSNSNGTLNNSFDPDSYVTFDCIAPAIDTMAYICNSGQAIPASGLCNQVFECSDKSDENIILCDFQDDDVLAILRWIILLLGGSSIFLYLSTRILFYFGGENENGIDKEEEKEAVPEGEDLENSDMFSTILNNCETIKDTLMEKQGQVTILIQDLEPIHSLYKRNHELQGDLKHKNLIRITGILRHIGKSPQYKDTADLIVDSLLKKEHDIHFSKEDTMQCLKRTQKLDYDSTNFFISTLERLGFFGKVKRWFQAKVESHMGIENAFIFFLRLNLTLLILSSLITLGFYYGDYYFDFVVAMGIHRVHKSFITSLEKLQSISSIDMNILKYYYPCLGAMSLFVTHAIYLFNIKEFDYYGKSLYLRIILLISALFPKTFVTLELCRSSLKQLTLDRKMHALITEKQHSLYHLSNKTKKYQDLSVKMAKNMTYIKKVSKISINFILCEALIETLPQAITITSLAIIEEDSSFGQLKNVFFNALIKGTSVNGHALIAIVVIMNTLKFSTLPIQFFNIRQHPMSIGILGGITRFLAVTMIIIPKFLLISVLVCAQPFIYPAIALAELCIITLYVTATQKIREYSSSILPSVFHCLLLKTDNCKFKILQRWMGCLNTIVLHFTMMLMVYMPGYYLLKHHPDKSDSAFRANLELGAFLLYAISILPYLAFLGVYHKYGRRWNENERNIDITDLINVDPSADSSSNDNMQIHPATKASQSDENGGVPYCAVDPMNMKSSFMMQNIAPIEEANRRIKRQELVKRIPKENEKLLEET